MKPVFDENGLATVPGNMRCFYYEAVTYEYTGWSDEYINTGVSMPACSTGIDPGEYIPGRDGAMKKTIAMRLFTQQKMA